MPHRSFLSLPLFLLLTCFLLQSAPTCSSSKGVMDLNDANFEHLTQASTGSTTGKWFVMFYASWCGACKKMKTILDELSSSPLLEEHGIIVAQCDAVNNQELAKRFSVRGYPMLLYFVQGTMYQYSSDKERDVDSLVEYLTSGYLHDKSGGKPVPPPPSWWERTRTKLDKEWSRLLRENDHLRYIVDDFEHIVELRKNAAVVLLLIGALIGSIFGCVLTSCCRSSSNRSGGDRKTKPKRA